MKPQTNKILLCEFLGSATVLVGIVGIGVNSNPYLANPKIQLITVVVAVAILISAAWLLFNRVCPVQLNPLLTLSLMAHRRIDVANGTEQIAAQVVGALTGVVIGNFIFGLAPFSPADQGIVELNRYIGEFIVSIGVMVLSLLLFEKTYLPFTGAIIPFWVILVSALSGSASFANPAISVANSLSHTVTSEPTSALLGLLASQLLGGIVGSGVMATNMSADAGVALLMNACAIGAALFVLITVFGPVSGAHFNPAVTIAFWLRREMRPSEVLGYIGAQLLGAITGTVFTNVMFELPGVSVSVHERTGGSLWLSEFFATTALITLILVMVNRGAGHAIPALVGVWIASAILFTSSTSFANPAVTIARTLSDTFTGIAPSSVGMFLLAQLLGIFAGFHLSHFLHPNPGRS